MEAGRDVASISLSVRGSMDALNAALAGLTYRSTLGYHGLIVVNVTMVSKYKSEGERASCIWSTVGEHRVYGKHCRLTFLFLLPPSNLFHCLCHVSPLF